MVVPISSERRYRTPPIAPRFGETFERVEALPGGDKCCQAFGRDFCNNHFIIVFIEPVVSRRRSYSQRRGKNGQKDPGHHWSSTAADLNVPPI